MTTPQPWRPVLLPGETLASVQALGRPVPTGVSLPSLPIVLPINARLHR